MKTQPLVLDDLRPIGTGSRTVANGKSLLEALRAFDATEANLSRLEALMGEIERAQPSGVGFGSDASYERKIRAYETILEELPKIDGWKPEEIPREIDVIGQARFDARELGQPHAFMTTERWIEEPGRELRDYRFRFDQARRQLVRDAAQAVSQDVDSLLRELGGLVEDEFDPGESIDHGAWSALEEKIDQLDNLLGSSVDRPPRWSDLRRHLRFAQLQDLSDIIHHDWPDVKSGLTAGLYDEEDPVPVGVDDLAEVVREKPEGAIPSGLAWDRLDDKEFERLIFALLTREPQYENVTWLTNTNAPDRGRDLSVQRVQIDSLAGTERHRVIVQCKHWLAKSVSPDDISALLDRTRLWEPPRVHALVIATSGRFTSDAVALVERLNEEGARPKVEMWPDSHLEHLLASRPGIVGRFGLR